MFEGAAAAAPPRPAPPHATASLASAVDSLEDMISGLIQSASVSVRDLSTLFDGFDLDGTGSISRAEFRKVLAKVGVRIGDEETRLLIDRFDADGNGRIEYREFVDMAFPSAERAEGGRRGERGRGKRGGGHDESVVDDLESLLTRMVRDAGYVSALLSAPLNLAPLASTPCSPTHAHQYPAGNGARVFPTPLWFSFSLTHPIPCFTPSFARSALHRSAPAPSSFTPPSQDYRGVWDLFEHIDYDGTGHISVSEFEDLLEQFDGGKVVHCILLHITQSPLILDDAPTQHHDACCPPHAPRGVPGSPPVCLASRRVPPPHHAIDPHWQ